MIIEAMLRQLVDLGDVQSAVAMMLVLGPRIRSWLSVDDRIIWINSYLGKWEAGVSRCSLPERVSHKYDNDSGLCRHSRVAEPFRAVECTQSGDHSIVRYRSHPEFEPAVDNGTLRAQLDWTVHRPAERGLEYSLNLLFVCVFSVPGPRSLRPVRSASVRPALRWLL